ncbi:MAG: hypothetical protein CM1200mP30_26310 [Pseudomonadota bacterium]|nr:MAG: hypothetical protein CM1200mP30_26310 [Pseudomonadota bacterium]
MNELLNQTRAWANGEPWRFHHSHHKFYLILPTCRHFYGKGYTKEEMKMINETKKIMNAPNMGISATCVEFLY